MLNVEQITNRLAQMPDPVLQKYAAMNKNDPYIMALAVSESNRRKQMRQAAQGAQGAQPQPKVVDQDIAGMAPAAPPMPEEQGIARLPAGSMNFADGGIVAFAEGGDVERYQSRGLVAPSAGTEYGIPGMVMPATSFMPQAGAPENTPILRRWWQEAQDEGMRYQVAQAQARIAAGVGTSADKAILEQADAAQRTAVRPGPLPASFDKYAAAPSTAEKKEAPAAAAKPEDKTLPYRPPAALAIQTPSFTGLDVAGMTRKALDEAGKAPNPFAADVEKLGKERVAAKEAEAAGLKAIQDKFSDIYKGREERLSKREGELAGMKDQNLGIALLQAGAAMMSTPGGLGVALGKGVDVGSRQYVAGMDKLNAAKEKLSDARDRLEEVQAQRGELSARELLKAQTEIKNAGISAREDLIKSNQQMYGVNRETALKMVDNQVKVGIAQIEQGGANARANAQIAATLNTPERQIWDAALKKHNGDTAAAFRELQSAKAEKFNPYQSYADYLKAFAGKENVLTPPMGFADYVAQFGTTTTTPPKGATVRTLPGG